MLAPRRRSRRPGLSATGKACSNCRKVKVKCDAAEPGFDLDLMLKMLAAGPGLSPRDQILYLECAQRRHWGR